MEFEFYKENEKSRIWWVHSKLKGLILFSFDKKKIYNLYKDYPKNLTKEQLEIFKKENPLLAEIFD